MTVENPPSPAPPRAATPPLAAPGRAALGRAWTEQRTGLVLLAVATTLLVLVLATLTERALHQGDVLRGVSAGGVDLSGMSEREALAALQRSSQRLLTRPITLRAGSRALSVDPSALGLTVDERATVRAAREDGRNHNPVDQLVGTVARRLRNDQVSMVLHFDRDRFDGVLDGWVAQTGRGLVDGGLRFEGTNVVVIPPKAGIGIDRGEARAAVIGALRRGESDAGTLAIGRTTPAIDTADVHAAARRARRVLAAPVTVTVDTTPLVLTPGQVAATLSTQVVSSHLELRADPEGLRAAFGPRLAALETAPADATFAVSGTSVSVVPAVVGQQVDLEGVARQIARGRHQFAAPRRQVPPARSTAWAEGLHITELVSSFTTNHPCCAARVTNIHRAADTINGLIVEAGQTFSLNNALGPRTAEKGYVSAPSIGADLEYEDAIGGGVSQVSTTLFNAVFFGCFKDVTHTVHALYITRYPMGREATLNYPSIDNKFRDDSSSGVLIRTSHTGTSITVSLYGNKEGRTCRAEGPNVLSTTPPEIKLIDDPTLPLGTTKELDPGHAGYVVENFRIISRVGQPDQRERYLEHYAMTPTKIANGTGPPPPPPPVPPPVPPPAP